MTIGEKISLLRMSEGISQESLADKLNVSRQSVSKWEMDQALPQIDKIIQLSDMFHISTDDFLHDDVEIQKSEINNDDIQLSFEKKFFGTDGFRGEANSVVTAEHAFKIGRFLGWYYASSLSGCRKFGYKPKITLGKDTRVSSYMFEYALAAGLTCSGADVYMLHVTTTPSVSYVTRQENFDCGIMISASHNPYHDNGIKLVNRYGEKMDMRTLSLIEAYLSGEYSSLGLDEEGLPFATKDKIGKIIDYSAGRNRYIGYLISLASHSYKNMRIGLDCANGSSWMIAPSVFEALGASTYIINSAPDGTNINRNSGSTNIEALKQLVRENRLDAGFAFDGDADRCIAVDENGNEVDGDKILYIFANRLKSRGNLKNNAVVCTVMSNSGLKKALKEADILCAESDVGDQNVYEMMNENGYMLGGEQSGHIILQKYATTGDGILTAIMLMEEIMDKKQPLGKLAAPVTIFPQVLKNVCVKNRQQAASDSDIAEKVCAINKKFGDNGKLLLRESGTEPVVRIMAQGADAAFCEKAVESIFAMLKEKNYVEVRK